MFAASRTDVFGFLKSGLDAHTMGINAASQMMADCGYEISRASEDVCFASERLDQKKAAETFESWVRFSGITVLGASYRLDPKEGSEWFGRVVEFLKSRRLFIDQGGRIRFLFFAGLPETCRLVKIAWGELVDIFPGGETPLETLRRSGVPDSLIPPSVNANSVYDEARLSFGKDLIKSGKYLELKPYDRSGYDCFGTMQDSLLKRLNYASLKDELPLFRAHMGPYSSDRHFALVQFSEWAKVLAAKGFLDILSIGSSQLTQSAFGENWEGRPNGGGVPINSEEEFSQAWEAARPMLVRTYAGSKDLPKLARMYNRTINNAWHALSLWWFDRLDGRGDLSLMDNLTQQFAAIDVAVESNRPFEPNVPHHFAFRGADDVTYIVSAVLATRVAKSRGVKTMILQNMLNTPSNTWGVQDLAKARAMLQLVRSYASNDFNIIYQPRAGLGYFAPDEEKAKIQLAASAALMDDVDPHDESSPQIVHVVSYSEAVRLATPEIISESVQITRAALSEYRKLRRKGWVDDMATNEEVAVRTEDLVTSAKKVLKAIDSTIPNVESPLGLYKIFKAGFLPVPDLLNCRDEFPLATMWKTRFHDGGYRLRTDTGALMSAEDFSGNVIDLMHSSI